MYIRLTKPADVAVLRREISVCGRRVPLLVLSPYGGAKDAPGVLWIHGGGYLFGMKEMVYMSRALDLVRKFGAVVVSPGYTLSFRRPYPAAAEDCYGALVWLKENARPLGVREDLLAVGGESAGGGLTAAVCMMARDTGDVRVGFQMPLYPMLDNAETWSSRDNHGKIWNTRRNRAGWAFYLRGDAKKEVSSYAAPARQTNYANLPPCYTFVGDGEPFTAETLQYVENLKKAGVEAKADVYPTDVHAFDILYPDLELSRRAAEKFSAAFAEWLYEAKLPKEKR